MRAWPLWSAPRRVSSYFLLVEFVAVVWSALAIAQLDPTPDDLERFALILCLAIGFEEGAKRAAQLNFRLNDDLYQDMASVWSIPAALLLPRGLTATLIVVLYAYMWFRQYKASDGVLYREVMSAAIVLIGCLSANAVVERTTVDMHANDWSVTVAAFVLAGVGVHAVVNRLLVTVSWLLRGVSLRSLAGTWDENLVEYATLCLGGLVTVSVAFEPWLTPLVVVPMISLQRGALVRKLEEVATT